MAATTTRALAYIATTSTQPVKELCTAAQAERIADYCKAHEFDLVGSFVDEGQPSRRTGLSRVLSLLEAGAADVMVVINLRC